MPSALGFTWKDHVSNKKLYAEVPKATDTVKQKRLKQAGHCYRHPEEAAYNLVLWAPYHASEGEEDRHADVKNSVHILNHL